MAKIMCTVFTPVGQYKGYIGENDDATQLAEELKQIEDNLSSYDNFIIYTEYANNAELVLTNQIIKTSVFMFYIEQ